MLTKKQVKEIKEHLDRAQNPLFFFDNDGDGLCSFLLLQRYIKRGKGVPIKSFPELTVDYFRKVDELNADYLFILDKPEISKEFFEKVEQINIPLVWIDHHVIDRKIIPKFVNYYNPIFNKSKSNEPVTALCYQITNKKNDLWLAIIGCVSDSFMPDFYPDFKKTYPDLSVESKDPLEIYYNSSIGKIANILNSALKDRTGNVIKMLKFLMKAKTPYDVLEKNNKNYSMHERFDQINKKYQRLLEKAKKVINDSDEILFFQYGGDLSISSDLANGLRYLFPKKFIIVAYIRGIKVNISARGENIRQIVLKAIKGLKEATAGGHKNAVGAKIKVEDLEKFKKRLFKLVKGK